MFAKTILTQVLNQPMQGNGEGPGDQIPGWTYQDQYMTYFKGDGQMQQLRKFSHLDVSIDPTDGTESAKWRMISSGHSKFTLSFWVCNEVNHSLYPDKYRQYIWDQKGTGSAGSEVGASVYLDGSGTHTWLLTDESDGYNDVINFDVGGTIVSSDPDLNNDPSEPMHNNLGYVIGEGYDYSYQYKWRHVVCTYDSSLASNNQKIYINGELHHQRNNTQVLNITRTPRMGCLRTAENMDRVITAVDHDVDPPDEENNGITKLTFAGDDHGFETNSIITISGTTNFNGTKSILYKNATNVWVGFASGPADESGLTAQARCVSFLGVNQLSIGTFAVYDRAISAAEVLWLNDYPRDNNGIQPNLNQLQGAGTVIDDSRSLFVWWTMGNGLEDGTFNEFQPVIHNMSSSSGHGVREVQDRDMYRTGQVSDWFPQVSGPYNINGNIVIGSGAANLGTGSSGESD